MTKRPKTVDVMQVVFAAGGDMAQVPADYSKSPSPYPRPPRMAHQRGTVFCAHPIGRSPQSNAGFRNEGERGASVAKQEFLSDRR